MTLPGQTGDENGMLSSTRSAAALSIFSALWSMSALGGAGCVDPRGRFDEFADRTPVVDAGVRVDAPVLTMLPDVTGTFLVGLTIAFAPARPVQLISTQTLTAGKLSLHLRFLRQSDRAIIEENPIDIPAVDVDSTGAFVIQIAELRIPKAANPLMNDAVAQNVVLGGMIKSKDAFCTTVTGMVIEPAQESLDGSTVGAIRIPDGASGNALPPPVGSCAGLSTPDAGAIVLPLDAGTDASTSPPDA